MLTGFCYNEPHSQVYPGNAMKFTTTAARNRI